MGNAAAHMARGNMSGRIAHMAGLVVKKEVGLKLAQELALGQAAQKHGLVHSNVPVHQRADGALVRRGAARRHQRSADAHAAALAAGGLLQAVQRGQQGLEGAVGQRLAGFGAFTAARQSWLQWNPPEFSTCGRDFYGIVENYSFSRALPMLFRGSGDCSAVDWTFLGGSIANWSFLWFSAFAIVLAVLLVRPSR